MFTPINKFKLCLEGKKVFEMLERYVEGIGRVNASTRNIVVTPKQYSLLLEGTPQVYHIYDNLPFGDFTIMRSK